MTDDQVRELDEQLSECGLTYNPRSELFQTVSRADADPEPVEWEDAMFAVPDLSLNGLAAYEERKQREWRACGGEHRKSTRSPTDGSGAG